MKEQSGISQSGKAPKQYSGEFPAQVTDVSDPDGLMRVQVRVVDIFDDVPTKRLPWAEYKFPVGVRPNDGFFTPCDVGDWVWVDFPWGGDSRRPRVVGGLHFCPESIPNLPHEAWDGPDSYEHKRTGPQLTPTAAAYHRDVVMTQHGILIEIVSGTEEVRVTQKKTGSAIEIDADGNVTAHSENNLYGSSVNNAELDVGQDMKARVARDAQIEAGNDISAEAMNDVSVVAANNITAIATNTVTVTGSNAVSVSGVNSVAIQSATAVSLSSPVISLAGAIASSGPGGASGTFVITGNLTVNGTLTNNGKAVGSTHTHPYTWTDPAGSGVTSPPS